ncbi:hypothetical protein HYV10_00040 [Candidatus Dependentiae bacterium]|nr:hypothetical protein [Candidatus Dependentiae bacterium]
MLIKKMICFYVFFFFYQIVNSHGFGGSTLIQDGTNDFALRLDHIVEMIEQHQKVYIISYDEFEHKWVKKKVKAAGFSEAEYHCRLFFNHDPNPLICTPLQLFYRVQDSASLTATQRTGHAWIAAHKLKVGDRLLCADNKIVTLSDVEVRHEKLKVYTLEIKNTHTFLVGNHKIVAHNMLIPLGAAIGFTIPVEIGCGASAGAVFGPVGICGGIVIGGLVGCAVHLCMKDRVAEYEISFKPSEIASFKDDNKHEEQEKSNGAQAPGKPTENDGFIPKKNWDGKKIRHPKGFGWPDKKGSVWIPSGPNGHGCPHWDVQHPNGDYDNVVPGGRIRGQK